jgi:hypothetical protein
MGCKHLRVSGIVVLLMACTSVLAVAPTYMPVSSANTNFHTGYQDVYSSAEGTSYGKAKIEWSYWHNSSDNYWYYAYKLDNAESGTPNNRSDDYHFGHVYNSGTANGITSFNLDLGSKIQNITGSELLVISSLAGSSTGGNSWNYTVNELDSAITGVNWSAGSGAAIQPTQWAWTKVGSNFKWVLDYSGDTSRNDSSGQYFEIASTWAPGIINAYVSDGSVSTDVAAYGNVYGPAQTPEPATIAILGLGAVAMLRRKK